MKMVISYLKPYAFKMCIGLLIKVTGTIMDLAIPYLLSYIIDEVIPTKNINTVILLGLVMIICAFLGFILNVIGNRMASKVAMHVTTDLRHDLFVKIELLSFRQMDEVTIPSLISRLSSDTYNVHHMIGMIQRIGIRAPTLLIGGIIITFTLDSNLALILLSTLPIISVITFFVTRRGIPLYTNVQKSIDEMIRAVRENASGTRVIKALSKSSYEKDKFERINKKVFDVEIESGKMMAKLNPSINFILNIGLVAVIIVGSYLINGDRTETGVIIAFTSYFTIILNAMVTLTRIFMIISRSSASASRIEYVFKCNDDLEVENIEKKDSDYHIEFNNVSFSYNKNINNVEDISFKLRKGEKLGIIGSTGSGKTTIVNLLMRFYDVDSGEVLINGENVKAIDNNKLKHMFGVVFQNDTIFNDTVYENIDFGRNLPFEEIKNASINAQAFDFINRLEDGFNTLLTPKGTNVSGGQKQRLLIARSLAGKPDILILDDATSALDYQTDSKMRKAIASEYNSSTTLIITQRVSSIIFCDLIIVLEEGRIIGIGKHKDLVESCEVYKEIYQSQMSGDDNE